MKPQNKVGLIKRYALFLVGLFIASMGVAFSTKAGLGTSPVASLPYSVSLVSKLFTFGGWLNLLSVIQIVTQVVILKGKVNYIEIAVQTVLAFVYGYLTNPVLLSHSRDRSLIVPDAVPVYAARMCNTGIRHLDTAQRCGCDAAG